MLSLDDIYDQVGLSEGTRAKLTEDYKEIVISRAIAGVAEGLEKEKREKLSEAVKTSQEPAKALIDWLQQNLADDKEAIKRAEGEILDATADFLAVLIADLPEDRREKIMEMIGKENNE